MKYRPVAAMVHYHWQRQEQPISFFGDCMNCVGLVSLLFHCDTLKLMILDIYMHTCVVA